MNDSFFVRLGQKSDKWHFWPLNNLQAKYVATDLQNTQSCFKVNKDSRDWLQYDFIESRVCPTHYSIRTRPDCDSDNPPSWVIIGSNTGGENDREWTVLNSHQNDSTLHGKSFSFTFDIKQGNREF